MRNLFFGLIVLFSFAASISAQANEAEKFDEFNSYPCDQYLAVFDALLQRAFENPSSTVYVLIYEGKEREYNFRKRKAKYVAPKIGSAKAKIEAMKRYLTLRNFSADRFSFIEAGLRENATVELWLVPSGAVPPKPTSTLEKMNYQKGKAVGFCTDVANL